MQVKGVRLYEKTISDLEEFGIFQRSRDDEILVKVMSEFDLYVYMENGKTRSRS